MQRAADYYRPTYPTARGELTVWSWSTHFAGVWTLFRTTNDDRYLADLLAWGRSNGWSISTKDENPNSVKAGQVYYDLHQIDPNASLAAIDATMSRDLAASGLRYDWIDALFMGLPSWARWAKRAGNDAYLDKMDALYAWTRDNGISARRVSACAGKAPGLYDASESLWHRDCRFIGARDSQGHKVFWSRGNAWVAAALVEVLATLPAGDPRAKPYADMLRAMAERLRALQGADGLWRPSLLSPSLYPEPETSGTALFTYAIAAGINAGLLERATYLPVLVRAWNGMTSQALRPTGFLTYCQRTDDRPFTPYTGSDPRVPAKATSPGTLHVDSPPFCIGAFLLAGSEMAKLGA